MELSVSVTICYVCSVFTQTDDEQFQKLGYEVERLGLYLDRKLGSRLVESEEKCEDLGSVIFNVRAVRWLIHAKYFVAVEHNAHYCKQPPLSL